MKPKTMRFAFNGGAAIVGALALLVSGACARGSGDSPTTPSSNDHVLSGRIGIFYSELNGQPVLQEAEVLVDGERVGHQSFVPGTDRAFFDAGATFRSAGSHTVALRVIRQSGTSVAYLIAGSIAAYRLSDSNSVVSFQFGSADNYYTMRAGEMVELVVVVP